MFYNNNLKSLRERIGLTQENLASILNIDRKTYSHYENEDYIIPIKHLNTICNYFDVSLDYMFGFTSIRKYKEYNKDIDKIKSGERLKSLRKSNDIPQKNMAMDLHVAQSTIAMYERGTNIISTSILYTLGKKFKISTDYLMGKIDFIPEN